jgi:hypothetical protein
MKANSLHPVTNIVINTRENMAGTINTEMFLSL